jgi:hypothetical protein
MKSDYHREKMSLLQKNEDLKQKYDKVMDEST